MNDDREIGPEEYAVLRAKADPPVLIDVREPWEVAIVALPGSLAIPLGQLASRLDELSPEQHYVVLCHHGARSQQAARYLQAQGFSATNLVGGIDAWVSAIEPSLPRY